MMLKRPTPSHAQPPRPVATPSAEPVGSAPPPASAAPADGAAADLLTTKEAAAVLRVAHKRLERWRMTGDGPIYVRMTAKSIVYRRADIDAFINSCLRANTAA